MVVLFYLCGDRTKASSRVRGYWIAEALAEQGVKCSLEHQHTKLALLQFAFKVLFHDVVVFQKTYSRWHVLLVRWARLWGKTTLLDLDDAPSRTNSPVTLRNVEFIMRKVSAVTVGSRALFEYASQFSDNVHLIPSSIRLRYYVPAEQSSAEVRGRRSEDGSGRAAEVRDQKSEVGSSEIRSADFTDQGGRSTAAAIGDRTPEVSSLSTNTHHSKTECDARIVTLGWIGNGKHYKDDLISILKEPLTKVAKIHPIRFKLIGACGELELYDAFSNIQGLEVDFVDQIEWADPKAVADALQDIDIGLYPLLPNEFNQYKCGFKALEYMAMRIPVISSDVAENREIIEEGDNGFFAESSKDWKAALLKLIEDSKLRNIMGLSGRTMVEERYSVTKAAESLLSAL